MNSHIDRLSPLVVGFYAWMTALFFGGILLDMLYFNLLNNEMDTSVLTAVFSEVSDVLLYEACVTILAAIGAIIFSWKFRVARYLIITSLLIILVEFIAPALLHQFIQNPQNLIIGPWLRIIFNGSASLLAFVGLHIFYRQKHNSNFGAI